MKLIIIDLIYVNLIEKKFQNYPNKIDLNIELLNKNFQNSMSKKEIMAYGRQKRLPNRQESKFRIFTNFSRLILQYPRFQIALDIIMR